MKTMLSYDECSRSCGALGLYNIPVDCDTREGEKERERGRKEKNEKGDRRGRRREGELISIH